MVPQKADNPHIPLSSSEIIEDVHRAFELGITICHLHARDAQGEPDWRPESHLPILEGIKTHCPGLVICFSSSGRKEKEFEKRSAILELKPDMCSLTLGSLNFMKQSSENSPDMINRLFEKMLANSVLPEFECFSSGMINYGNCLKQKFGITGISYWNLLFGNIFTDQANLLDMGIALNAVSEKDIVAIAGLGQYQLKATSIAIASGYGVRIGLEDNLYFDKKRSKKASNFDLLKRTHELMAIHECELLTSMEFRELTGARNCMV
jgi:3-keto-5-aminohexanoate cleavage enzyme